MLFRSRLLSVDNAFVVLSNAFEEFRDDERFGPELERLAGLGDKWQDFVSLFETVLQAVGHVQASVALHLRVAAAYDRELHTPEHAGTHYQYVLSIEPENLKALDALESLLVRYNKWPEVVAVLQRRADLSQEPASPPGATSKGRASASRDQDWPPVAHLPSAASRSPGARSGRDHRSHRSFPSSTG